jgi:hypothetical protein
MSNPKNPRPEAVAIPSEAPSETVVETNTTVAAPAPAARAGTVIETNDTVGDAPVAPIESREETINGTTITTFIGVQNTPAVDEPEAEQAAAPEAE